MREILFRGKRIDNGEWVEGFYHHTNWYDSRTHELVDTTYSILPINTQVSFQVDPKTIGQFTGMMDETGQKIFEGDYLELEFGVKEVFNISDGDVRYSRGGFFIGSYGDTLSSFTVIADYTGVMRGRIIGNIHDNPELL